MKNVLEKAQLWIDGDDSMDGYDVVSLMEELVTFNKNNIMVSRALLFSIFGLLLRIDFDNRDQRWEDTTMQIKQILNDSQMEQL